MIIAGVLLAAALVAVVPFGPVHRWRLQASVRDEARLAYPGSDLLRSAWQDEEHARYIDTGGYDEKAGWSRRYDHDPPVAVDALFDFYRRRLGAEGWRVAGSYLEPCTNGGEAHVAFARQAGDGGPLMTVRAYILGAATGADCTSATSAAYEVDYSLPWRKQPSY